MSNVKSLVRTRAHARRIPAILTGFNLALVILYWFFERNVPKTYQPKLGKDARDTEGWARRRFIFRALFTLPKFFWILCGTRESPHDRKSL